MNEENKNKISFESLERVDDNFNNNLPPREKTKNNKKVLAGVCSSIGAMYNIDPFYIRLAFIFSLFIGIWGVAGYLAAAIIITKNDFFRTANLGNKKSGNPFRLTAVILLTILLVLIFYVADFLEFFFQPILFGFSKDLTLFILLLTAGIIIFIKRKQINTGRNADRSENLYRTIYDKKISGVCGGLAVYFNQDSNFIRLLWILFSFLTAGIGIIIYIIFMVIVPAENLSEEVNG
jgi:phage shock protein C